MITAGCGSSHGFSVRDVERAFFKAGVPFEHEQLVNTQPANPYLKPRQGPVTLPRKAKPLFEHLQAVLTKGANPATFTGGIQAFVFNSKANADAALKAEPLSQWLETTNSAIRVQDKNVLVLAVPSDSAEARRIRRAIASLH